LRLPYVYDIVLSDFGRVATLRLLGEVASIERDIVRRLIGHDHEFFDEYRRIMFTCVGDIAHIKSDTIRGYADRALPLDRKVLFGVGETPIPTDAVSAIADVLIGPISEAVERGYQKLRIVIPCNTLAEIDYELVRLLDKRLPGISVAHYDPQLVTSPLPGPHVMLYSVPRVVLGHLLGNRTTSRRVSLVLIGTAAARSAYQVAIDEVGLENVLVVACSPEQQVLMDQLVAASIDGDQSEVASLSETLERQLIHAQYVDRGSFVVVQASTDLSIGLGTESLKVYARQLVLDAYRPALDRIRLT
jgi:hypothetical protein